MLERNLECTEFDDEEHDDCVCDDWMDERVPTLALSGGHNLALVLIVAAVLLVSVAVFGIELVLSLLVQIAVFVMLVCMGLVLASVGL